MIAIAPWCNLSFETVKWGRSTEALLPLLSMQLMKGVAMIMFVIIFSIITIINSQLRFSLKGSKSKVTRVASRKYNIPMADGNQHLPILNNGHNKNKYDENIKHM